MTTYGRKRYCPYCGSPCTKGRISEPCESCQDKIREKSIGDIEEKNKLEALSKEGRIYAVVRTDEKFLSLHLLLGIDDLADAGSCVVDGRWLRGTLDGVEALVPLTDVERIVDLGAGASPTGGVMA